MGNNPYLYSGSCMGALDYFNDNSDNLIGPQTTGKTREDSKKGRQMSKLLNKVSIAAMVAYAKANDTGTADTEQDDDYIPTVKASYLEETGKELAISDELLAQVLSQHKTFDEMETSEQIKFLTQAAAEVAKVAVSDPGITTLIAKIDDATSKFFEEVVEKVLDAVNSPMDTLARFRSIYTKAELDSMPWPGLDNEKMDDGDNRRPNIVHTTTKSGDKITTNWVNDFVSSWGPAKQWEKDLDDAKKELASSGSVPRFKGMVKRELLNLRGIATKRRNAFRSMVSRTLALHHNISAIEMMPKVELIFSVLNKKDTVTKFTQMPTEYGKKGKGEHVRVTRAPKPFFMYSKSAPGDGKDFSVSQISNMDVRAAIAAGGEMADLTATIAKGADDNGGDQTGDGSDATIDDAYDFVTKATNFFSHKQGLALVRKILADPKHKDHNDWLQLVGELGGAILPTYRQNLKAYEALSETVKAEQPTPNEKVA